MKRKVEFGQYVPTCPLDKDNEVIGMCKQGDCIYYGNNEIIVNSVLLFIECLYPEFKIDIVESQVS